MAEKTNQENSDGRTSQTQDASSRNELQIPVSCVDHLLQEEQYGQCVNYSTSDFLLAMLDYLTDYILEMVGTEASNNLMNNSEGGERSQSNNRESSRSSKDTPFSLFDEMPGARRTG
ncbi:huntingtin-interacting protein M [Otolemur garnettii]|uniref:Huntingtin-interacting protein M n=1 Tax=Otolemur garnettii TaxID=30611 RepID=H0XMJ8_OTOGA|nr:huntingtin-interacting protein M [Otolemur garnettii]